MSLIGLALILSLVPAAGVATDSVLYVDVPLWQGGDCTDASAGTRGARPCRARTPGSAADVRARWAAEGQPVWADSDTLTFVFEGAAEAVHACCAVQMPMSRFAGTDLWVLSVRVPDLSFATIGYGFRPEHAQRLQGTGTWRGLAAPAAPPTMRVLQGTVQTDSLWSAALGERRAVTVYLPPGRRPARPSPVVYVADGQSVAGLAAALEPFILSGEVPPTVLVGLHSGPFRGEEYTSISEATNEADDENPRFVAHERFVLDEVLPWAERTLGASARREERAAFGFSNGAVWAAFQGVRHPDVFGAAIAFSCGACGAPVPDEPTPASAGLSARFYFLAGRLEAGFHRTTAAAAERLRSAGYEAPMHERVAGHDWVMWNEQFGDALRWAFGRLAVE